MQDSSVPSLRLETVTDLDGVRQVHELAFGRSDEASLVDALRREGFARVSLVAEIQGNIVGHLLFSDLAVLTDQGVLPTLSLAPLAVLPTYQKQGIGSALVREGLRICRERGHRVVAVLGHEHYYPRFGFSAELAQPLLSPFSGHPAWMALELVPGALAGVHGWTRFPPPFGLGVQVRPLYHPDRAEWARMRTALWPDEGGDAHDTEVAAYPALRDGMLLAWQVFVADRPEGGLGGFVEASIRPWVEGCSTRPVGYVEGWYVDPGLRRQGIGRKLVEAAQVWVSGHGCQEMASDAHLQNTLGHQAHRALGFEETAQLVQFRKALPAHPGDVVLRAPDLHRLTLLIVSDTFAVCKLPATAVLPDWASSADFFSFTRTAEELSLVCRQDAVPAGVVCERGWRGLRVAGTLPFTMVGVLASLAQPLAHARVGSLCISTFDTDYLFVKATDLAPALRALRGAGHQIEGEP